MAGRNALNSPAHRIAQRMALGATGQAPDSAPSMDFLGAGIQDHRVQYNLYNGSNQATAVGILGWYGNDPVVVCNVVPAAVVVGNIAAAANAVSGVAMVLAGASTGITLMTANTPIFPGAIAGSSLIPAGALVLDGLPGLTRFGSGFVTTFYNRTTMLSRAVSITGVVGGVGGAFLVSGYDVYGYPMSQTITVGAGAVTATSLKTFKFISSVVPQFTDAHTYSVQTADVFGFGLFTTRFEDGFIHWNGALITTGAGLVGADSTTATALTGDVRGTYAPASASDGVKRLVLRCSPIVSVMQINATTGLFGTSQA